jgi:hypothetical protein
MTSPARWVKARAGGPHRAGVPHSRSTVARIPRDPMTDALTARLTASREAFRALRPRIEAREATTPWPLATAFGTEPEASWGVREVLAHVQEMLPYWLGEYERVQAGDGTTGVPFGRVATDTLRTGVLERDRTLPLRELLGRIDAGIGRWVERLDEAGRDGSGDAPRPGVHPRLGDMTPPAIAERFVVSHLEEHDTQLRELLGSR